MKSKLKDFNKVKNYCESMKKFYLYEYLCYFGISSIKRNIKKHDLISLIDICNKTCSDYSDPIELSRAVAEAVLIDKYISIEDLKKVPTNDLYDMYFEDKLSNLVNYSSKKIKEKTVKTLIEPYIVKIGFDYDECKQENNIISGKGSVYYYNTKVDYDNSVESNIVDFSFKYNIDQYEISAIECSDEDAKCRVESNEDNFIDNIITNLLPQLESSLESKNDIEKEMDL